MNPFDVYTGYVYRCWYIILNSFTEINSFKSNPADIINHGLLLETLMKMIDMENISYDFIHNYFTYFDNNNYFFVLCVR